MYNASQGTIDLGGWQLDDGKAGSAPFEIPQGMTIAPHGFLVFFAAETTVGLNNNGDRVRLLSPDSKVADKLAYMPIETNGTYASVPDGSEVWVTECVPTPGTENCSRQPTATPTRDYQLTPLGQARQLPDGATVSVMGSIIERPCELSMYGHDMTISDGEAGLHVYLAYPHQLDCSIARNEQVVVTGVMGDFHGLRTIYPQSVDDIVRRAGAPREIAARAVHTGEIGEGTESMRVMIEGVISNGKGGEVLWVNDGTGIVEVYVRYGGLTRGSRVRIFGMGQQNNRRKRESEGHLVVAWQADDLVVLELEDKVPEAPGKRGGIDLGAVSIAQALTTRPQNYVTIGGVVTVPPGLIGERNFWIQDASGQGARIFVADAAGDLPKLKLYENVSVRGRVVSSFGAREIRVELPDSIGAYGRGTPSVPRALVTGAVDFSSEGALVAIEGFVARADGREIYIDDGTGEVLVYMDATTRIRWRRLARGDPARIIGVVARFRGEPEILPRYQSDVQFGAAQAPVVKPKDISFLQTLRVSGRAGEEFTLTRRLRGEAGASPGLLRSQ